MRKTRDAIAIIGAACRFPGAPNLHAFWDLLQSGGDAVSEVPDGRWSKPFYFHPERDRPGKSYTWAAGTIGDIDGLDTGFFGIAPREADQIDPQQRLALELTWEALEDAGIPAARLAGSETGVFVGASSSDYAHARLWDPANCTAYFMTGTAPSIVSNRISYTFDLHGPSLTVDTACSSSLVALDLACKALRDGGISTAIVGGVNLLLSPYPYIGFCAASMLSPSGRCFAFDRRADGYVRGEGGGVAILKPLRRALADGNAIRGVIVATAVNSDGHTTGLALPNRQAQMDLLRTAYAAAQAAPDAISFVEAHGTGTPAGDPAELAALGTVLGAGRLSPLPIGSVKTNIGHLETAAGMAGLFKAMLSLEARLLPPSLHFSQPNPDISFTSLNLAVAAEAVDLPLGEELLAGVNSFGFGGTNAHAILASPPRRPKARAAKVSLPPLLLSARAPAALDALTALWAEMLSTASSAQAAPLLRAAARGRDQHRYRCVAWGDDPAAIAAALQETDRTRRGARSVSGSAVATNGVAFVFSGNGAQWLGMAQDALMHNAVFRQAVAAVDRHLEPLLGWSVRDRLAQGDAAAAGFERTDIAQPLLFAVQIGIATALRAGGVDAAAFVGHSVGEIAAAWAAGALPLDLACRVIFHRSRQQQKSQGIGRMAVLSLPPGALEDFLPRLAADLDLAAVNTASSITLAGTSAAIARLQEMARREGWRCTVLDLDYAFHSALLDPIRDDMLTALADLQPQAATGCFVSTVTGAPLPGEDLDADYWWRNIRDPVQFTDAVGHLVGEGVRIFVEIGPHPILQSYLREALQAAEVEGRILSTLNRRTADHDPFPAMIACCHVAGCDISGHEAFDGSVAEPGALPLYPWQRERRWFKPTSEAIVLARPRHDHPLLGFRWDGGANSWTGLLDTALHPWLADHRVDGAAVMPAAAVVEIALAAARAQAPDAAMLEVTDLELSRMLSFEPHRSVELRLQLDADRRFALASRVRLGDGGWSTYAAGRIAGSAHCLVPAEAVLPEGDPLDEIGGAAIYRNAAMLGLDYGPDFQVIERVERWSATEATVHFKASRSEDGYLLSPRLLDGALQGFIALLPEADVQAEGACLLPWRFGRVRAYAPHGRVPVCAALSLQRIGTRSVCGTVALFDSAGQRLAAVEELWLRRVQLVRPTKVSDRSFHFALTAAPLRAERVRATPNLERILVEVAAKAGVAPDEAAEQRAAALLFDGYLAASAHAALAAVVPSDRMFTLEELAVSQGIAAETAPLLGALLTTLESSGLAHREGRQWRILPATDFPEPGAIWRSLLDDVSESVAELSLTAAASAQLPQILHAGFAAALPLPPALVEHFLYASPAGRMAIDALCRTVEAIAADWPATQPLRILEIGAGTGVLSRALLRRLAEWPGSLIYVASDNDADRVAQLSRLLDGAASAVLLNAVADNEDAALGGPFDLIVSAYGLTRQFADSSSLAFYRALLAPDGMLLTAEPLPNGIWDRVFGGTESWWYRDLHTSDFASSLYASANWRARLAEAGFVDISAAPLATSPWVSGLLAARCGGLETAASDASPGGLIAIVAEASDPIAPLLAMHLTEKGFRCERIPLGGAISIAASHDEPVGIALLPRRAASTSSASSSLVDAIAVAQFASEAGARLWLVTRGVQGSESITTAGDAVLWGAARSLRNEMPQLDQRSIDFRSDWTPERIAAQLAAELAAPDAEREIVWTDRGRQALRLRRGLPEASVGTALVKLDIDPPGVLDGLRWRPFERRLPGVGEIAIDVKAVGLNFRDVMWAMGVLPEEALLDGFAGASLGLECAGIVSIIGTGVEGIAVGDRVVGFAPASLASEAITLPRAVVPLPAGLGFAAAATLPVAYLTAVYALGTLARLEPGETVLIHGGAGGVGLAAIAYARNCGAVVIATAGSETKREFLGQLGVDHILDSRSLDFADAVRALTDGAGVGVVLNSLGGEAMECSLSLLRPFGRFLELGKRDFYLNTRVGLRPLRQNISYFSVDIDRLPVERPALAARLLGEVAGLVETRALPPLPYRPFPFSEAAEAFRLMQGAGHIGKIVLVPDAAENKPPPAVRKLQIRDDATYLVTGGLTGFGLETARWLVGQGARHLVLLGRRGAAAEGAAEALAGFDPAVTIRSFACDVADEHQLAEVLVEIRRDMPPLCGVVHAAMVLSDGLLATVTAEEIAKVLTPKLDGAANLDRLTRGDPLDFLLLYSSATTVLGAPGQGSYVGANLALEAIARHRSADGLPTLAIAWGPIADAGYLAREPAVRDALARRLGAKPIAAAEALNALPALWASCLPVVAYASVQWEAARRSLPILSSPSFAGLVDTADESDGSLRDTLTALPAAEAKVWVERLLARELGRVLSLAPETIDPQRPLAELGMDSLMTVELRLAVESRFGVALPLSSLADAATLAGLAKRILAAFAGEEEDATVASAVLQHEGVALSTARHPVSVETSADTEAMPVP